MEMKEQVRRYTKSTELMWTWRRKKKTRLESVKDELEEMEQRRNSKDQWRENKEQSDRIN